MPHKKEPMFCFECKSCGFGLSLTSGVVLICPICGGAGTFRRITHERFHQLETTEIR